MENKEKSELLEKLRIRMKKDTALPLRKEATQLVFGEGDPDTQIMFIGEGPGYWEDQKGRPFVGNAGALLNQLLSLIGLTREKVFITNVVHYRPPQNRDPELSEIKAFEPYLNEMIDIIEPKMIVTLGRFSMAKFLPGVKITSVHGKKYSVNWRDKSLVIVPMFHPAAALRSVDVKRQIADDFKKLPEYLREPEKNEDGGNKNGSEQMELI